MRGQAFGLKSHLIYHQDLSCGWTLCHEPLTTNMNARSELSFDPSVYAGDYDDDEFEGMEEECGIGASLRCVHLHPSPTQLYFVLPSWVSFKSPSQIYTRPKAQIRNRHSICLEITVLCKCGRRSACGHTQNPETLKRDLQTVHPKPLLNLL